MNIQDFTAREFNGIADSVMIAILVAGLSVGVLAEVRFYSRARSNLARAGKLHHYWFLLAAMLLILAGALLISAILPGDDWETRRALLVLCGVLLGVIALLRATLMKRINRSE